MQQLHAHLGEVHTQISLLGTQVSKFLLLLHLQFRCTFPHKSHSL